GVSGSLGSAADAPVVHATSARYSMMCGFAGILTLPNAALDRAALDRMGAVLTHRGPDDVGMYVAPNVGFVFRRLSILDVTDCGHQPMISEASQYVIVSNG